MTNVFEFRTGKFTPLPGEVLVKFSDEQRTAYDELASEVAQLDAANVEAENSIVANRKAVAALHAAETAEAAKPRYTFLDELRATQAQWRKDNR